MLYIANAFSLNMLPTHRATSLFINPIDKDAARDLLKKNDWKSMVGHPDIAAIIGADLDTNVPVNRATLKLDYNDSLLIAQYIGPRLAPGTTKLPDDAKIQYFLITQM